MTKLGRWVYCKYCYKNVAPYADHFADLVVCGVCGYGLAPLHAVEEFGSYGAWYDHIVEEFQRANALAP